MSGQNILKAVYGEHVGGSCPVWFSDGKSLSAGTDFTPLHRCTRIQLDIFEIMHGHGLPSY